ncbi:HEAT repeat domain-containing protein [Dapis sp. BLCC M126]|uniref:HEAT repeat domain-containing protein n=1 Tax=Dapis sp. BLCC M126 TaxID=3400189 RepID=UPI003CF65BAA
MESFFLGWELPKIAAPLLGSVLKQGGDRLFQSLNKTDIEKAIESGEKAVKEWEKILHPQKLLFYSAKPDGWNGFNKFLREYFHNSGVLQELQKPLINQGKPDIDFLISIFQQEAEAKNIQLNSEGIQPWIETFVNAYFQQTDTYIKFQVAKQNYFEQLANWFDDVKFAGISVPGQEVEKSEKLANIFVMPDVLEDASTGGGFERDLLLAGSGEKLERELLVNTTSRKFLASELLTQSRAQKFVILGAPGSGKTTLMSYFAVMLAQKQSQFLGLDTETDWLPILIRISDLARHPDKSILEYARIFAEKTMAVKTLPTGFFKHWLEDGRALILLDGLDEVAESSKRYDVVKRINNFLGKPFDTNRAIITSRPAGYQRDFFRTEEFAHYQMQRFDDQKISAFINNWYDSRFKDKAEAERRKETLQKALDDNDRIKLLARNPLLLTIIALIHRYQAVLPKERFRLYDKAVETLLTSWDANKELSSDGRLKYLGLDDLRRLMELLAYWVHTQGNIGDEGGTLIEKDELIRQLRREIKRLKQVELYQAEEEAERFVDLIRERTGLLNEQGQDYYAFVHKTFQEYLCAEDIDYQADNEDDFEIVLGCIREHLHESHWEEVLLLLIAQQKPKKVAKAMRGILERGSEYEEWLHRDLLFAGSCLTEDPKGLRSVDGGLVREVLERLVELEVSSEDKVGKNVREQVKQIFCSLYETDFEAQVLEMLKERADLIDEERLLEYRGELGEKDEVTRELLALLQDENYDVRRRAALALGNLKNSSETVINSLLPLLEDRHSDVCDSAAFALSNLRNSSEIATNSLLAQLQDENYDVRWMAASALENLQNSSETVINSLLPLLQDRHSDVRWIAANTLGRLGNSSETVIKSLLPLLQDENSDVRRSAAEALGTLGNSSEIVINSLLVRLQDENYFVRGWAAIGLGKLNNSPGTLINCLLALFQDENSFVRGSAAIALGNLNNSSENVIKSLVARLKDENSDVRGMAAIALGNLNNSSETVINSLLVTLQDEDSYVCVNAAIALGNLNNSSETVINSLLVRFQDKDYDVPWRAAETLGKLGKKSNNILPTIVQWIQQHQDSEYVGRGIDVLWYLVVGEES